MANLPRSLAGARPHPYQSRSWSVRGRLLDHLRGVVNADDVSRGSPDGQKLDATPGPNRISSNSVARVNVEQVDGLSGHPSIHARHDDAAESYHDAAGGDQMHA